MSTNVNIVINAEGLLDKIKGLQSDARQALLTKERTERVESEAEEKREERLSSEGKAADQSPLIGTITRLPEIERRPAAYLVQPPQWGMGWIYTSYVDWTKDPEVFGGYMYAQKIQVQIISGDKTKKVTIDIDAQYIYSEVLLPVRQDLFVYVIVAQDLDSNIITRSALVGFSTAKRITSPENIGDKISNVFFFAPYSYGQVGWLLDNRLRSPNPNGLNPDCDLNGVADNFSPYNINYYGFVMGGGAYTLVLENQDISFWDFGKTAFMNGMKTPPLKLSGKDGDAWREASCSDFETFTYYNSPTSESEQKLFFPSVYSLFKQSGQGRFATQYSGGLKWKSNENGYYGYPVQNTLNLIDAESPSSPSINTIKGNQAITLYQETYPGIESGFLYAKYDPTVANPDLVTEALCIAVIDETSPGSDVQTQDWNLFRSIWPDRPFALLVPFNPDFTEGINYPDGWNGTTNIVSRDNGNVGSRSDWYEILGLDNYPRPFLVSLFIDNSGSMTTSTVSASLDYFGQRCAENEVFIAGSFSNPFERYILPFANAVTPGLQNFYNYEERKGRFYCALSNPWNKDWSSSLRNLGFNDSSLQP